MKALDAAGALTLLKILRVPGFYNRRVDLIRNIASLQVAVRNPVNLVRSQLDRCRQLARCDQLVLRQLHDLAQLRR